MKDIATTFFKIARTQSTPDSGSILVAEPFLNEPYFGHAVVSLIDYSPKEGATGVVMNHSTGYNLQDLLEGIRSEENIPVFCGGPVGQDRLYYLHTLGDKIIPGARLFAPGLYVGGDYDSMTAYVNAGYPVEGNVRFFIGYSGWTGGQLENELDQEAWVCAPGLSEPEQALVLQGDAYWHRAVRSLGENYRPWQLVPANPRNN